MEIHELKLLNYRNYENASLSFKKNTTVLFGNNAQGKTNLLEAVYLFCYGRSHRTNQDKDLISFNKDASKVIISFTSQNRKINGEVLFVKGKGKQIKINGVRLLKVSELPQYFKAVLFTPDDLNLVKDGPDGRRKFLDFAISSLRPNYYSLLGQYAKLLKQKNNLLRSLKEQPDLEDTLSVWNERLALCGAKISLYRATFLKRLDEKAKILQAEITGGKEELSVIYSPNISIEKGETVESLKNKILQKMNDRKWLEIEKKTSLFGIHRDDFILKINGLDVRTFASQGQMRTTVLSLKIAQTEIIKEEWGEYPLLLLDDIMSELDASRRAFLTEKIKGAQIIITCTDTDRIDLSGKADFVKIKNGTIIK